MFVIYQRCYLLTFEFKELNSFKGALYNVIMDDFSSKRHVLVRNDPILS